MERKVIVEARGITKRFPGVLALDGINLHVVAGEVNALVGENGAGKSTLMNILSGVYTDYEGDIVVDGEKRQFAGVADAQRCGITIVHQELNLVPYLNIAENIFLGREPVGRLGLIDKRKMHHDAHELISRLHLSVDTHTTVADLNIGQQQLVEIAKALSLHPRVLIMDEPTSSLSESETQLLFNIVRELKAQGVGIVYISHKMEEVSELADFVTILRDGKLIAEKPMQDTSLDEIVSLMVGRDQSDFFVKQPHQTGEVALEVEHLSLRDANHPSRLRLSDISLQVHRGEVLGIYGLMGAGRTELLESIFGVFPKDATGTVKIEGRKVAISHPQEAVAEGLALCPEDRKQEGLVLGMTIADNVTLASLRDFLTALHTIDEKKELNTADKSRDKLQIKSNSSLQTVGKLSGGNQQKVVLAKWLLTKPKVLLLDEPTRGIDINAKTEIYRLIDQLAQQGMALVVVSSELPEIMAISDRIMTLRDGRVGRTFERSQFSEESILKASLPE